MMYVPHLFITVSVYADNPGMPFSVYLITPDLTPEQIEAGRFPPVNRVPITSSMNNRQVAEMLIPTLDDSATRATMLDALNQNKLLTDTGELVFDLNQNTYMVQAPNNTDLASVSIAAFPAGVN